MKDVLGSIRLDDLEGDQRQLAETIGIEAYRELVKNYGGTHIYVPGHEGFYAVARNEQIRSEFDGYNFRALAQKYELTESSVRRIVEDIKDKFRKAPIEGQESFY